MAAARMTPVLGLLALVVAAACFDGRETPTAPDTAPQAHPDRATAPGQLRPPGSRRNPRAFSVRVEKDKKRIELTSVGTCDPETDTGCSGGCDLTADVCGTAEPIDEPLDAGQLILGDATTSEGECPRDYYGGIWFRWRGHEFVVWGHFIRQTSLRSWPWGEAEYALPPGPHESQDNKATIWNGVLKAKCFGYADSGGGFSGIINWTWVRGEAQEHDTSAGGGSGWDETDYYSVSNGNLTWDENMHVSTGDAQVDAVLNKWLDTAQCTDGWVLIVDGVRVC